MRSKLSRLLLCLLLAGLSTCWLLAQDDTGSDKSKSDTRTITGCLTRNDSGEGFVLTGQDGSTWEVHSSTVSLADHVGHEVQATGVVGHATTHNLKGDAKDAAADAHVKESNNEHGDMTITEVQTVSDSCK
ncbi:MAG TPA: DUF5818 domain-containing protein [Terriglobales bacterium]|nr:DUF5818 domain-containing protein [Terriglobales bacterium]